MPARTTTAPSSRAAVSVSDMARRCELSRSHFNLLIRAGIMPAPLYDLRNRRPFYDAELQQICVRVRETSIGADGKYVVFYDRRSVNQAAASPTRLNRAARSLAHATAGVAVHAELIEGLVALGIQPTVAQVETALRACYPAGHDGIDEGTVLRELWRHLRRPNVDR